MGNILLTGILLTYEMPLHLIASSTPYPEMKKNGTTINCPHPLFTALASAAVQQLLTQYDAESAKINATKNHIAELQKKYDELAAQLTEVYISALEPFEKAYEVSEIPEVKAAAADYLKRLNFQLRNVDPKYQEAYEKWNAIVENAQ